jgi:hypothetical protein
MAQTRRIRTSCKVCVRRRPAAILEQLQLLADHPALVEQLHGHRPLDGLRHLPRDSRRPNRIAQSGRSVFDYSSPSRDEDENCGMGLL